MSNESSVQVGGFLRRNEFMAASNTADTKHGNSTKQPHGEYQTFVWVRRVV
jgi:hypothetical protein